MKGSKWAKHIDFILQNRDKMDSEELAAAIGTTRNNLHKICYREGISLPRKNYKTHASIKDMAFFRTSNHEGYTKESAIAFLNSQGYRVMFDPFMMPKNKIEGFDKDEETEFKSSRAHISEQIPKSYKTDLINKIQAA